MTSRQRVSIACQACRKRRVKCDGAKPSCSRCTRLKEPCEYRHSDEKRKPPSKRYIQSLLSRIESLERQVAQYEGREPLSPGTIPPPPPPPPHHQQGHHSTHLSMPQDSVQELVDLCGGLSLGEGEELRFFDSRSNLAMVSEQLDERCHDHLLKFSADRSQRPGVEEIDVGPAIQGPLLDLFWRWQNPWQYLLHESAWRRSYERRDNDYCTPTLLYAMLAVAARYSDEPALSQDFGTYTAGIGFAAKAKQLVFEEMEAPRVSTVVAAALISVAELALDIEPAGWTYIGMAVRMAYTLGLHTDPRPWVESGRLPAEDAEIRSVAWWGCYMIEKLYSLALGRPSACIERDIHTPLPAIVPDVEFKGLEESLKSPSDQHLPLGYSITNFRYTCEMLRLVTGPLDEIYSLSPMISREHRADIVLKASVALSAFYDRIPSVMRLPSSGLGTPLAVHIYYFHIHYHGLNILLHRPFISRQTRSPQADNQRGVDCTHLEECTRSAEALTATLKEVEKHYSLRTATISVIHPCLTAGLIHLCNWTLPSPGVKTRVKKHFLYIMHSLSQMSTAWVWALRAMRLLKLVARRWLPPEEFTSLMANELAYLSGGIGAEDVVPVVQGLPDAVGYDPWAAPLWSEGDLVQSGLLFDLGLWESDGLLSGESGRS
ncbi:Zn(II)2Cys6 transcription factor [Aspergillus brunneoviolaceus CBS 621.78]|uniref:Uncharacterized protein n=1 Tax=Aspergillus brunneoviolaceus CBS 621.78 TaxID=1450534 RepID=A0ACD1GDP9_9EURO|nr:hypothetical protein BO95DRAFT_410603 [Aspergillus brunneoviolaceus CBS 621.78]RAH47305.1 hypothetical protein BO95DRAFT_410603 [Aspergillus brunneoviolaceus CBS 621.78]